MEFSKIIEVLFSVGPGIPIYYYGRNAYNLMENEIKIYWRFLIFAFVFQTGLIIAAYSHHQNSFFVVLFQMIEYTVLSLLFYMWNSNRLVRFLIPLFLIVNIASFIYFFIGDNISYSVTIDKYLRNFVLIPLSFYTAYIFATSSKNELLQDGKFWILSGILINTALCAFVVVFRSHFRANLELHILAENLLMAVNLLTYIIFIKGFLCFKIKAKFSGSLPS